MNWQRIFPFLVWPRLTVALAKTEAQAGLTVAWIIIPQGIAYALLAGMPPVTGIYMALLPAVVAVLWGASPRLATGPAALTCVLVGSSLAGLHVNGQPVAPFSADWVVLSVWLALLAGSLQMLLGFIRFGWFISLVSSPVMMGFTQAAGCLIIASQLPTLFGVVTLAEVVQWPKINGWALCFGAVALSFLWASKRWSKKIPWILLVIIAAATASWALSFATHGAVVGAVPVSLPPLSLPSLLPWGILQALLLPAAVIALVSFLEAASSAKMEHQKFGTRWNDNQDLIGQGAAKITGALLGTAATSASFSRSALNVLAGAQSGWSACFMALFALGLWVLGAQALAIVPRAVLAAVIIVAVSGLIQPSAFKKLWLVSRTEASIAGLTFAATLATAPALYWGVFLGVGVSLSHFLYQRLHPRMIEVGLHGDGSLRDRILWTLPPLGKQVFALRMDAALDFASSASFERQVFSGLATRPDVAHVCIFAQPINWIDATGIETLNQMHIQLASKGIVLHLSGLKLPLEKAFVKAKVLAEGPYLVRYRSESETVAALKCL